MNNSQSEIYFFNFILAVRQRTIAKIEKITFVAQFGSSFKIKFVFIYLSFKLQ